MKRKMRMATMLTCAAMLCSRVPAAQVQAAKQKDVSALYYFGLTDGEMFRDMEIIDDKGMLQWIVTGEGYGTKDTPYYVCTYHLDKDFTQNVWDADAGEMKQETYHISRQMLYVVVPRQNYLRFELRNDIDMDTALAQASAIVSKYDENAGIYRNSMNPDIRAYDISMPDHTGSAETSEAVMNELNDAGLISAFYTWGQSAYFHEVEHGQLPTGYLPFIEQYHVDEWLTEHHPEYNLMQVTKDSEYADQLTLMNPFLSISPPAPEYVYAVIPPEGASFGEQLAVAGELYEAFDIRPEFYVLETGTETLAGKNALADISQNKNTRSSQLEAYIAEHELPVLYTSRDMHYPTRDFLTVICEEEYADAVRSELADYVKNTLHDNFPDDVFVVQTEKDIQLEKTLRAFIADRGICATVTLESLSNNMIEVYFSYQAYDSTTDSYRGMDELKAYLKTIHVNVAGREAGEYDQTVMLMWEEGLIGTIAEPLRGDIDNNGNVNALDAQLVLNNALELMLDNETEPLSGADIDGDGEVTSLDAQYILLFYLHNDVLEEMTMWKDIIQ